MTSSSLWSTQLDAVMAVDSWRPKEPCVAWGPGSAPTGSCDMLGRVLTCLQATYSVLFARWQRRRCGRRNWTLTRHRSVSMQLTAAPMLSVPKQVRTIISLIAAYCLCNSAARNYHSRLMHVEIIAHAKSLSSDTEYPDFNDSSEHICFLLFTFYVFHFIVVRSVR